MPPEQRTLEDAEEREGVLALRYIEEFTEPAPDLGPGWRRDPETGRAWYSAAWL